MTLAKELYNEICDSRTCWLEDMSATESDVYEDEHGEFIVRENEVGTASEEGYDVRFIKVYLPEELCD